MRWSADYYKITEWHLHVAKGKWNWKTFLATLLGKLGKCGKSSAYVTYCNGKRITNGNLQEL